MKRIPRKRIASCDREEVGEYSSNKKTCKLSQKQKSIIDRKHDSWTVEKAHERLKRELHLLRCFLTIVLSLFKDDVKKLVSQPVNTTFKCNMKAVAMFASIIKRRFKDEEFIIQGCGLDLNIISKEELDKLREGKLREDEVDTLAIKTTLNMINCFRNILQRQDATDSALKFLMSKVVCESQDAA